MRSVRVSAVAVLAVVLALSSVQNAFAAIEIAYDDGDNDGFGASGPAGQFLGVRFSLPPDWSCARLLEARFFKLAQPGTNVWVHILNSYGSADLPGTTRFLFDIALNNQWNDADLSAQNIVVTGDFWIAVELIFAGDPIIGEDFDDQPWDRRSYLGYPGVWTLFGTEETPIDLMIRAVVDYSPCPSPVGGILTPANRLAMLTPYLALLGLATVITVVAVAPGKRSDR